MKLTYKPFEKWSHRDIGCPDLIGSAQPMEVNCAKVSVLIGFSQDSPVAIGQLSPNRLVGAWSATSLGPNRHDHVHGKDGSSDRQFICFRFALVNPDVIYAE